MKEKYLYLCRKIFAIGFILSAFAFAFQAFEIFNAKKAQDISLITFIVFSLLHINGIFYSYFIAKDKILIVGTLLNAAFCITIVILKILYG